MPPLTLLVIAGFALVCSSWLLVQKCGFVMSNGNRCRRTRRGLGRRCQDHSGVTVYDLLSIVAFALGVGAIILWYSNDGLYELLTTFT